MAGSRERSERWCTERSDGPAASLRGLPRGRAAPPEVCERQPRVYGRGLVHLLLFLARDFPRCHVRPRACEQGRPCGSVVCTLFDRHIRTLCVNLCRVRVGRPLSNANTSQGPSVYPAVKPLGILEDLRVFTGPRVLGEANARGKDVLCRDFCIKLSVSMCHVLGYTPDHIIPNPADRGKMLPKTSRFRQESGQEWAYNLAGKTNKDQANAWGLGHWGPLIGSPLASDPGFRRKGEVR